MCIKNSSRKIKMQSDDKKKKTKKMNEQFWNNKVWKSKFIKSVTNRTKKRKKLMRA